MIEEPFFELTVEQKNKMAQGAVVFRFFLPSWKSVF